MNKQVPENPEKNRTSISHVNALVIIAALMITCYLTSNIMAVKLINVWGLTWFDAGTLIFPLAYILGDVLTEVWGFKTARQIIYITFACELFFIIMTSVGIILPSPDYMEETAAAYKTVFSVVPRILAASLIAFLIGELSNAWFMVLIKKWTRGRFLWMRTIGSSVVGFFLDTVIFVLIAFAGTSPASDIVSMIFIQYAAKLGIETLCATPFSYALVKYLKRREGISN